MRPARDVGHHQVRYAQRRHDQCDGRDRGHDQRGFLQVSVDSLLQRADRGVLGVLWLAVVGNQLRAAVGFAGQLDSEFSIRVRSTDRALATEVLSGVSQEDLAGREIAAPWNPGESFALRGDVARRVP